MRRSLLLLPVLLMAAAAIAAPSTPLPGETRLAPAPVGIAPGLRSTPAVAASANRLLSVWIDRRADEPAIFGQLLDRTGQVLFDRSFRIGAMESVTTVAAASNGRDFLVAWGRSDGFREYPIRFARVDELGNVTPLSATASGRGNLKLVWSGTRYVLLSGTPQPVLAVLTSEGVVERSGIDVTLDPLVDVADARLATDGRSGLLVTWVHRSDARVHAATVTTEQLLNGTFAPFATQPSLERGGTIEHAIAWNGSEYLLAWIEVSYDGAPLYELRVRRLSRTGEGLSVPSTVYNAGTLYRPHVAWSGSNWVITGIPTQRHAIRVSAAGQLIGEPFVIAELLNAAPFPVVAIDGGVFAAWQDGPNGAAASVVPPAAEIRGDIIFPTGAPRYSATKGVLLSRGGARQESAAIASCGSHFAAAWVETNERSRIRAGHFQTNGQPAGEVVTMRASDTLQAAPAVGCSGNSALVVWTEPDFNRIAAVYGSIVTPSGASPAFTIGTSVADARPAVAWNGSRYLVAWKAAETQQLVLSVLDAAGSEVEPPMAVQDAQSNTIYTGDRNAAIAWSGSDYFLAWQRTRVFTPQIMITMPLILFDELQTLRLSAGRTRLSSVRDIVTGSATEPSPSAGPPALAAGPNGFLLAWFETAPNTNLGALKYVRFDRDGNPLDAPRGVALTSPRGFAPVSSAWNGTAFEIAFDRQLFTVYPDGRTTARTVISNGETEALAYSGDRPLLVFTRPDPAEGTLRLWGSDLTSSPAKTRRRPAG